MLAATLTFLTPAAALVALAVLLPLAAAAYAAARSRRGRALLGLAAPPRDRVVVALAAVPLLLALAAAEPVLRSHTGRRVRLDAQAIFVFDTSRSMAASAGRGAPTRLALAKAAAVRLRTDAIGGVPTGVASLTTQLLPHLFPTLDEPTFASTVRNVIGVEQPPPPALGFGLPGTSYTALQNLRNQGFFTPWSRKRLAVLLTDGESGPYEPRGVADALVGDSPPESFVTQNEPAQARVSLVVVRVGGAGDRIYDRDGSVEATYRPDPKAASIVSSLAAETKGRAFTAGELGPAGRALRAFLGPGKDATRGVRVRNFNLAPFAVAAALIALALVVWRRNATAF
jgi:hypothetical protein